MELFYINSQMQSLLNTMTLASPQLTIIWLSQHDGEKPQGRLPPQPERAPAARHYCYPMT